MTFYSVVSLQIGGLERCRLWFSKPVYLLMDRTFEYDSLPFGGGDQKQGLAHIGWSHDRNSLDGGEANNISIGKTFGYDSDISEYVWLQLCQFFKSEDLRQWDIQAKKLKLKPCDFLLEMDLDFSLNIKKGTV